LSNEDEQMMDQSQESGLKSLSDGRHRYNAPSKNQGCLNNLPKKYTIPQS
jgi:hypothetical protein